MATRTKRAQTPRETDLYGPLRDYLVSNGYSVRAEVNHCDVIARKDDELIVVEMKLQFGVDLLVQATDRRKISESVYVAVPKPSQTGLRWRGIKRLLRRLELGLIFVSLDGPKPRVEVVLDPAPYQTRKNKNARRAVIREIDRRSGDYNQGGSTKRKLVTAYRENAIQIACCLEKHGPLAPKKLRAMGTGPKTLSILRSNFYGWFDRVEKGVYTLSKQGAKELNDFPELAERYRAEAEKFVE